MDDVRRPSGLVLPTAARLRRMVEDMRDNHETRLPPEVDLSKALSVGRPTLREALRLLEAEGLLSRGRRTGTHVNPNSASSWGVASLLYPLNQVESLTRFMQRADRRFSVKEIWVRFERADSAVASALLLPDGTEVAILDRVFMLEDRPAIHAVHYFPPIINGEKLRIDQDIVAAIDFLRERHNVDVDMIDSQIVAEVVASPLAEKLALKEGAPLLVIYEVLRSAGQIVAIGKVSFVSELISLLSRAQYASDIAPQSHEKARHSATKARVRADGGVAGSLP